MSSQKVIKMSNDFRKRMVLRARLELARIAPHAPQTCAATNYAGKDQSHFMFLCYWADVWIKTCLKVGSNKLTGFFRAENAMRQLANV